MQGKGKLNHPSGDFYEGEFVNNNPTGLGKYVKTSGEIYEGFWLLDKPHGKGKYRFSDGMIKEGIFENGQIKKTIKEYLYRDFVKKQTNMFIKV